MTQAGLPIVQLIWEPGWSIPGEEGVRGRTVVLVRDRRGDLRQWFVWGALDEELVALVHRSASSCARLSVGEQEATITERQQGDRAVVITYRVSGAWLVPLRIVGGRYGTRSVARGVRDIARAQGVWL